MEELADRIDAAFEPEKPEPDLLFSTAYDAIEAVRKGKGRVTFDCWWENMNSEWGTKPE